jgi:hypothetical protein
MGLRECQLCDFIYFAGLISLCRLRLQIYKGMGFEPVADKEGRLSKMLVRK